MPSFRIGPSVKARDKYVLPGSLFGTVGFLITTYGFRIYVENSSRYDAMYGSLGGVMVLMIWFYISSFVLLLAGQINKYFMQRRHSLEKRS
ncbi:MAG: YihY/virulence factor BrkB family protein [Cyanobacteriota/Melainabacteria group bacterium]